MKFDQKRISGGRTRSFWVCKCDCGNEVSVIRDALISGDTKSCGCRKIRTISKLNFTHGKTRTPLYQAWGRMIARCTDPNNPDWRHYGGRGIGVCDGWKRFEGFEKDMAAGFSVGLTLDRINNEDGYKPGNCRWATRKEQANNRRTNRVLTFNGTSKTLGEWAEQIGIGWDTLKRRIERGWCVSKALTTPKR